MSKNFWDDNTPEGVKLFASIGGWIVLFAFAAGMILLISR